jgi:hypothetical protein
MNEIPHPDSSGFRASSRNRVLLCRTSSPKVISIKNNECIYNEWGKMYINGSPLGEDWIGDFSIWQ